MPLLCLFLLGKSGVNEENALVRLCKRAYRPLLARALEHRVFVLAAAVAALVASLALAPRLGTEFLPELNEGSVWINLMLPPGISVTETLAAAGAGSGRCCGRFRKFAPWCPRPDVRRTAPIRR